jgi:2-oxoglutarate/2-oxoacid ferredoxin oxidoreductase subunit beta
MHDHCLNDDWEAADHPIYHTLEDYEGGVARWCPGCGDLAVLTAVQRILRDEQADPEKVVSVSGIGCASRFPHYMATYGFHGLHGRALPVACGIKSRRPDLDVWVATGDGDCCSIGAAHWVHAIRFNMNITVMLFDNQIYGLTKKQSSPTSPVGMTTNTHPRGIFLPPLNPIGVTLGLTNASFVAQTVDWNPAHLHATLALAHKHKGLSFVRIMQRCPTYTANVYDDLQKDPSRILMLTHADGIADADGALGRVFKNRMEHDPADMREARDLADQLDPLPIGIFFRDESKAVYDSFTNEGLDMAVEDRLEALDRELDRFLV